MRVRTEARRQAILETAARAFLELGYERASMSEIAARLGGSKATLYGYFPSKEDLFVHVVEHIAQIEPVFAELAHLTDEEPRRVLERTGERFLAAVTSPDALAAGRMVIAQSAQSDNGQPFLDLRAKRVAELAAYLLATTKAGRLNVKDPPVAALHLLALFESDLIWRALLGSRQRCTRSQIRHAAAQAVGVFMAAYGPAK